MCSCSHSAPSKAGKRARERRRLPEDQALGRWGSLGVEGLREGLGHLGWACRMAERQTGHRDTQKYRYSRERRNGARGGGMETCGVGVCKEARCLYRVQARMP